VADPGQISTKTHQYLGGDSFAFTHQAQEQVLRADVVVAQLKGFP